MNYNEKLETIIESVLNIEANFYLPITEEHLDQFKNNLVDTVCNRKDAAKFRSILKYRKEKGLPEILVPSIEIQGNELSITLSDNSKSPSHIRMVRIPAGEFMMRHPDNEKYLFDYERKHKEVIAKPFYMSVYEVTRKQWLIVTKGYFDPEKDGNANLPMTNISYDVMQNFLKELNQLKLGKFRLPTEAEWEYAYRVGSKGSGDKDIECGNYAWIFSNSSNQVHSVGLKKENKLGLYDMCGNVWEWCSDWPIPDYPKVMLVGKTGSERPARGGFFGSDKCTPTLRATFHMNECYRGLGLRLVRESRREGHPSD